MDNVKCLNPWDPNGIRQYDADGCFATLNAGNLGGQNRQGVCYAIEGNIVDRVSSKNGKGWCENVAPTLNTQDKHAICFQLCGDRDNPSVSVSDKAYCIPANPMSDRGQAVVFNPKSFMDENLGDQENVSALRAQASKTSNVVCIALEGNGARPSHLGKGFSEDGTMYTLNTIEQHSVCYGIDQQGGKSNCCYAENVMPTLCSDSHGTPHALCYSCVNKETSATIQAKNNGSFSYNYLPPVLKENK